MQTPPLPADENRRLQVLHDLEVLDTAAGPGLQGLAESAARLAGCASAIVTLIDHGHQCVKAGFGVDGGLDVPREITFCTHTVAADALLEVPDAQQDPRFADNPLVLGAPFIRFYAGHPLRVDGFAVGTLSVIDTAPRRLDDAGRRALEQLAGVAAALLQTQRALRQEQLERQRLDDFARASGDWLWELDAQWRYRWLSDAFEAVTGQSAAGWIGRTITDAPLLDAAGQPLPDGSRLHDMLRTGRAFSRALAEEPSFQRPRIVSRSAVPLLDATGAQVGWRGTTRDMTQRVQIVRQAREGEALLGKLAAQLPGALHQFSLDGDGRVHFSYVSDGLRDVFGVRPAQVRDDATPLLDVIHPDDCAAVRDAVRESQRTGAAWRQEYRVRAADGAERWIESQAQPEPQADGGTVWHGFSTDITARKQLQLALSASEARWALAADAAHIGLARMELPEQTLHLDRQACVNHGLPYPHAPLRLDSWAAQIVAEDRVVVLDGVRQLLDGRERLDLRYRFETAEGRVRWLEVFARMQTDSEGRATGVLGACRDITAQRETEQLRRDKEATERAHRAQGELLSRLSHELRTPLNGILGFAQLMALDTAEPLGGTQQRRLEGVQRAGRHLLGLVDDVLELTRLEQGEVTLQPRSVDLVAVLHTSLGLVRPLARVHGGALPEQLPEGPRWAWADARALEHVLVNLLSNAIQYNRPGGAVEVSIEADGPRWIVEIGDQGRGLSADEQARLFQPFQRLGGQGQRTGRGLGLVISRRLVDAMDGSLTLRSAPGQGTRARIALPRADEGGVQSTAAGLLTLPATLDEARPSRTVLYIEDEPLNVLLMEEVFRVQNTWALAIARDGEHGLALAAQTRPDLLLIDMNLPDMNGLQLIRRLRADPATASMHCIALSADAMPDQIAAARAAGFDDYWTKPIDVPRMLGALAEVFEQRRGGA